MNFKGENQPKKPDNREDILIGCCRSLGDDVREIAQAQGLIPHRRA